MALQIIFLAAFLQFGALAEDCDTFPPEINMNFQLCCTLPNISDPAVEQNITELVNAERSSGKDNFLISCKVTQTVFTIMKLFKDKSFDKNAYNKMIDSKVSPDLEYWKQPLKDAFDQCQKNILADTSKITDLFSKPPFNIKKDDCDAQHLVMFLCLHLDSFVNCPDKAWKVTDKDPNQKPCMNVKTWLGKCRNNLDALRRVVAGTP